MTQTATEPLIVLWNGDKTPLRRHGGGSMATAWIAQVSFEVQGAGPAVVDATVTDDLARVSRERPEDIEAVRIERSGVVNI
jgi:hypothetical protein